ncbi:Multi antimicrobial extrusion protein [Trypanosoma melophagium]|uniref:Multi antimicrobial extrusion protein n=1 Tax=Trypanosoma melophagium TaxID=715481 RepID=UPI00351A35F5|nr:Multi antimicrobial extrusion protein [Trypanosoma melophagium]
MPFNNPPLGNESFVTVGSGMGPDVVSLPEDISTWGILKNFFFTGLPLTVATISQFSIITVILAVVGKSLGVDELGGATLALGLINATAFAFSAGSCGALETVLSQTYGINQAQTGGRGPMYMYGTYTQRMTIILLVLTIPLGLVLLYVDMFLEYIGQSVEVVYFTGRFCSVAAFGILSIQAFQILSRYYACQQVTTPLSVASVVGSLMNPVLQIIFIKFFGFDGSPVAWLILFTGVDFGLIGYAYFSGLYKQTWAGWDADALRNIGELVKLAIPSMAMMLSEWVAVEVICICAGFAKPFELAAFSITMQIFCISWGVASGIMILVTVFIGNSVGEGRPLLGKRIAKIAVVLVFCIAVFNSILWWSLEDHIPHLFTNDERVGEVYRRLMRIVLPYHIFDTFQSTVMGILRGCGLQKTGAIVITTALCIVGLPIAFYLFFHVKYGIESLWIGPFAGVVIVGAPSYIYLLFWYIDWPNLRPHEESPQSLEGDTASPRRGSMNEEEVVVVEEEEEHNMGRVSHNDDNRMSVESKDRS